MTLKKIYGKNQKKKKLFTHQCVQSFSATVAFPAPFILDISLAHQRTLFIAHAHPFSPHIAITVCKFKSTDFECHFNAVNVENFTHTLISRRHKYNEISKSIFYLVTYELNAKNPPF